MRERLLEIGLKILAAVGILMMVMGFASLLKERYELGNALAVEQVAESQEENEEESEAVEIKDAWLLGTVEGTSGSNVFTELLFENTVGEASALRTFLYEKDAAYESAIVVAGREQQEGILGSIWYVTDSGYVTMLEQNVLFEDIELQYIQNADNFFFAVNYKDGEETGGHIIGGTESDTVEILEEVEGKKYFKEGDLIQVISSLCDSSVTLEQDEDGNQEYVWSGRTDKLYEYRLFDSLRISERTATYYQEESVKALSYGEDLIQQVQSKYPESTVQYLQRGDTGQMIVNVCMETDTRADFYYMIFESDENSQTAVLKEEGNGFYRLSLTGENSLRIFLQSFGGEGHFLPEDISVLQQEDQEVYNWPEQSIWEDPAIVGAEYVPEGVEAEAFSQWLIPDFSKRQEEWYNKYFTVSFYDRSREWVFLIQDTEHFSVYGTHVSDEMIVLTPDDKYVKISDYFVSNYGVWPEVLEADFDKDGNPELAIKVFTQHGTGVAVQELYMIDKTAEGVWYAYEILGDWYNEELRKHFDSVSTPQGLELFIDGVSTGHFADMLGDEEAFYTCGDQIAFLFEGEEIILESQLEVVAGGHPFNYYGDYIFLNLSYQGEGQWTVNDYYYELKEAESE